MFDRSEIINLINQYIYANGQQRITGSQLNEILIVIANAFSMEGSSASGDIDQVLATGNVVSTDRSIINLNGGKLVLSGEEESGDGEKLYFSGLENEQGEFKGIIYNTAPITVIGNVKSGELSEGTTSVQTQYNAGLGGERRLGIISTVNNGTITSGHQIGSGRISMDVGSSSIGPRDASLRELTKDVNVSRKGDPTLLNADDSSRTYYRQDSYGIYLSASSNLANTAPAAKDEEAGAAAGHSLLDSEPSVLVADPNSKTTYSHDMYGIRLQSGDSKTSFMSRFDANGENWSAETEIAQVNRQGLRIHREKKIQLSAAGENPTAGVVTLSSGKAGVSTNAIGAHSVVSLTVQEEGNYRGQIRVSAKVDGERFEISSSNDADDCTVFWQIIELPDRLTSQ